MNSNLSTLAELQDLQNLSHEIYWTIADTIGKLPGYIHCIDNLSEREWPEWRQRVYDDAEKWDTHFEVLQRKFLERENTVSDAILELSGQSNFKYAKSILSLAHSCFFDGLLPSVCDRLENGKKPNIPMTVRLLRSSPIEVRTILCSQLASFCQKVLQSSDIMDCQCQPSLGNMPQSKLQLFLAALHYRVSEEFDAAKKLAIQGSEQNDKLTMPKRKKELRLKIGVEETAFKKMLKRGDLGLIEEPNNNKLARMFQSEYDKLP